MTPIPEPPFHRADKAWEGLQTLTVRIQFVGGCGAQRLCRGVEASRVRVRLKLRLGLARQGNEIQLEERRRRERRREKSERRRGRRRFLYLSLHVLRAHVF